MPRGGTEADGMPPEPYGFQELGGILNRQRVPSAGFRGFGISGFGFRVSGLRVSETLNPEN